MIKRALQIGLPAVVLVAFGGVAYLLANQKTDPVPRPPKEQAVLVEAIETMETDQPITVVGQGTVEAAETLTLRPEVGGRIVTVHPDLTLGSVVPAGDTLIQIDPREYKAAVEELRAQVSRARTDYEVEKGRVRTAQREWKLLGGSVPSGDAGRALALREPQMKAARAALSGARGSLDRAELNLERATITAPFEVLVAEESVSEGQVVSPQATLASLVSTQAFWVRVNVPVGHLRYLQIPGVNGATEGSRATVIHELGDGRPIVREGRVVRLLSQLDPAGRMARVLVEVEDPLARRGPAGRLPLMLGAYVRVEIGGPTLQNVVEVPRDALREGRMVWLIDEQSRLEMRPVTIRWRRRGSVLVSVGLEGGERVVTSRIGTPVAGMLLEVSEPDGRRDRAPAETLPRAGIDTPAGPSGVL